LLPRNDLVLIWSWSKHTKTVVKRAREHLYPLRRLKRFDMGPQILKKFYSCTIESILNGCITAWYGNCPAADRKALQKVVRTSKYITGAKLPAIQDLYARQCQRKDQKNCQRLPSHRLFSLLPHGKRCRRAKYKSLLNSFYPQAIRQLIKWPLDYLHIYIDPLCFYFSLFSINVVPLHDCVPLVVDSSQKNTVLYLYV
jgi:hypothetical protein